MRRAACRGGSGWYERPARPLRPPRWRSGRSGSVSSGHSSASNHAGFHPVLESERFLMNLLLGNAEAQGGVDDLVHEAVGAADIDVAVGDVRDQPPEHAHVEPDP